MLIEVVKPRDATNKEKGDILEKLAENFLKRQRYQVSKQVRITASELDLLCKHKVSEKTVYVECKAHKDPLSVNVLKNLLVVSHILICVHYGQPFGNSPRMTPRIYTRKSKRDRPLVAVQRNAQA